MSGINNKYPVRCTSDNTKKCPIVNIKTKHPKKIYEYFSFQYSTKNEMIGNEI